MVSLYSFPPFLQKGSFLIAWFGNNKISFPQFFSGSWNNTQSEMGEIRPKLRWCDKRQISFSEFPCTEATLLSFHFKSQASQNSEGNHSLFEIVISAFPTSMAQVASQSKSHKVAALGTCCLLKLCHVDTSGQCCLTAYGKLRTRAKSFRF